jgi:hypothetical protein
VKLTKILGLAMVAAVAVAAFAGSASAARLHPLIKLCLKRELLLCKDANILNLKEIKVFGLQIGTGKLEGTINQSCTGGEIEGELLPEGEEAEKFNMVEGPGAEESRLLGKTTKLTFTGCEPCKKITTSPPFTTNLRHPKEGAEEIKLWFLQGGGNAKFEECTFGVTCKFGSKELKPEPYIEQTPETEAVVNTNKAELTLEEGSEFFCGKTGKWNARYKLHVILPGAEKKLDLIWPTLCKKKAVNCLA